MSSTKPSDLISVERKELMLLDVQTLFISPTVWASLFHKHNKLHQHRNRLRCYERKWRHRRRGC